MLRLLLATMVAANDEFYDCLHEKCKQESLKKAEHCYCLKLADRILKIIRTEDLIVVWQSKVVDNRDCNRR